MKITIEPTRELYNARINDTTVPVRMWCGRAEDGIEIGLLDRPTTLPRRIPPFAHQARCRPLASNLCQSIFSAVCFFFIGLALPNFFKLR
jgi:hypothetical protein